MTKEQDETFEKQRKEAIRISEFLLSIGKDVKISCTDSSHSAHQFTDENYGLSYYLEIDGDNDNKIVFEINDDLYVNITTEETKCLD